MLEQGGKWGWGALWDFEPKPMSTMGGLQQRQAARNSAPLLNCQPLTSTPLASPAPTDLPACAALGEQSTVLLGAALLLSHLLCRALAERPFASSDAPAWFEATARMARAKLAEAAAGAPKDSLQLPAGLLAAVLGNGNPMAEVGGFHTQLTA